MRGFPENGVKVWREGCDVRAVVVDRSEDNRGKLVGMVETTSAAVVEEIVELCSPPTPDEEGWNWKGKVLMPLVERPG